MSPLLRIQRARGLCRAKDPRLAWPWAEAAEREGDLYTAPQKSTHKRWAGTCGPTSKATESYPKSVCQHHSGRVPYFGCQPPHLLSTWMFPRARGRCRMKSQKGEIRAGPCASLVAQSTLSRPHWRPKASTTWRRLGIQRASPKFRIPRGSRSRFPCMGLGTQLQDKAVSI